MLHSEWDSGGHFHAPALFNGARVAAARTYDCPRQPCRCRHGMPISPAYGVCFDQMLNRGWKTVKNNGRQVRFEKRSKLTGIHPARSTIPNCAGGFFARGFL
jgi:hypothetical protein